MERLTEKHYGTDGYYMKCSEVCANDDEMCGGCPYLDKIIDRLGAYEDTGLTPEQISAIAKDNNVPCKWIPVSERLPDVASTHKTPWDNYSESVRVLCACLQADGKRMVKEGYCKVYEGYEADPHWKIPGTIHSVTHWMPLPEAPKGE